MRDWILLNLRHHQLPGVTMLFMGAVYSVIHRDEGEARRRLAAMCAALGLRPLGGGRLVQSPSTGKWMGRAEDQADDTKTAPPE